MEDFKQYLSDDADDRERAAAEQVREGLAGLRLEAKINAVAAERRAWLRRRLWQRTVAGATLTIIVGAALLFFLKKETPAPPPAQPSKIEQTTPPQEQGVLQRPPEQQQHAPIVERPRPPRQQAEQPLVRSVQPDLDSTTNRLIDILLRMTAKNDPAFNLDTYDESSNWGNAVRLLLKNKPAEAKVLIFKLEKDGVGTQPLQARWLLGIALLEERKVDEAQAIFEKIAQDPSHPRRKEAQLAAEALRKN